MKLCEPHSRLRCAECAYEQELKEENKRMRECLELFADESNWHIDWKAMFMSGDKERETPLPVPYNVFINETCQTPWEMAKEALEDEEE